MNRAKRPASHLSRERPTIIVVEEINSVTHALACLAGLHTWSTLDPKVYGKARGCMWCGEVKVECPGPLEPIMRVEDHGSSAHRTPPTRLSA
jgi:hypothetical protein